MEKKNPELINVYHDTLQKASDIMGDMPISFSIKKSVNEIKFSSWVSPKLEVINSDSISAAIKAQQEDENAKICILNMASRKRPGGGVRNGAKSQEEDLFRCTTLGKLIPQKLYPLKEDEFVYTNDVHIFKDASYEPIFPVLVDVVSVPAINLNRGKYNEEKKDYDTKIISKPKDYQKNMFRKIHAMISSAADNNCNTLILGAWGCGVFKNMPEDVALFFRTVLVSNGHVNRFKRIIFPIINDRNSRGDNFDVFKKYLKYKFIIPESSVLIKDSRDDKLIWVDKERLKRK